MTRARTIRDLIEKGRAAGLIGRDRELDALQRLIGQTGPLIAYLHGPYGIGKSALLEAFEKLLPPEFIAIRLAGSGVEPQPPAVIAAFAHSVGATCRTPAEFSDAIAAVGRPAVLMIDDVDALRLVATWLRREFVSALPSGTRLVLAGRSPPAEAWTAEYGELFIAIPLRPLAREAVASRATALGLDDEAADWVWDVSAGHPLSMQLALQAARAGLRDSVGAPGALAETILAGTGDPMLRRLSEAAAVVRRMTRPLACAMLGQEADGCLDGFASLPFVQLDREGLYLAEPTRRAFAARLSATDPERYAELRSRAVSWITNRLAPAGAAERWRYMADLLHLVEHRQVRDAFFPPDVPAVPVEPAGREDLTAVLAIVEARIGPEERRIMERWAQQLPHRFNVARGGDGKVRAFYVFARDDDALDALSKSDPLLTSWRTHLAQNGVAGATLFMRQLLAADPADDAPERAACILDLKRVYFERWDLSRVYAAVSAGAIEGPVMRRLGFRPLRVPRDGMPGSMVLDLPGSGLVGWIATLVGASAGAKTGADLRFARDRREVTVEGTVVQLTPLEAGVLATLVDRAPAVVTREALIEAVWQRAFVGSNVVDAVIRTLRYKLGSEKRCIVTVPKSGYRFVAGQQEQLKRLKH
jgi:hypothetical protein